MTTIFPRRSISSMASRSVANSRVTQPSFFARTVIKPMVALTNYYPPLRKPVLRRFLNFSREMEQPSVLRGYEPSKDDTFAACAPKSGTNWLMQIQYQIATRGEGDYEHIHEVVPWPDGTRLTPYVRSIQDLRRNPGTTPTGKNVIKTHLSADMFSREGVSANQDPATVCKFVTIFRDPKEVVASAYPFLLDVLGVKRGENGMTSDEFVEIAFGNYMLRMLADHAASFWQRRHLPNYLFLNYRDLTSTDIKKHIAQIAELMEVSLTPAEVDKVAEKASLPYMKSIKHKFQPPRLGSSSANMIRQGKSGKAVDELGQEVCTRIDTQMRKLLLHKAPDFPYDEFCSVA